MILDKDKYAELQFKKLELQHKSQDKLLSITTTPKVDAVVKLAIAFRDVFLPLLRPLGSFAMAVFGGYCAVEGIALPEYIQVALFGAPVGWGYSRHVDKKGQNKQKNDDFDD
jgi:hypothetical protein